MESCCPADVLLAMPHLNRALTVRLAAINAALAGCRPEYFPVLVAAWESLVDDVRQAVYERAVLSWADLVAAGKDAVSSHTHWRLPAAHPDALPASSGPASSGPVSGGPGAFRVLNSPGAVLVVVAGAANAGVSAVVETFGPRGGPPPVVRVQS